MKPRSSVRSLVAVAVIALLGIAVAAVPAAARPDLPLSPLEIAQLSELLRQAYGGAGEPAVYRYHGDGAHSLTVALRDEDRGLLRLPAEADAEAAQLSLLGAGAADNTPAALSSSFDSIVDEDGTVHLWAIVYNSGNAATTKKVTNKTTCPGRTITSKPNVTFGAGSVVAFWVTTTPLGANGICSRDVTVPGASPSNVKAKFLSVP